MHYQRLASERELLDGLAQPHAAILCGGTDAMIKIRAGLLNPSLVLDISRIESLQGIRRNGDAVEIGSATSETEILRSPLVRDTLPLLGQVLVQLGSVQIRNRGTLGGNIVNASPASDSAIPLLLFDTEIQIVDRSEERWMPLESFFIGPGKTALESGQFIRTLRIPIPREGGGSSFHKVGKRNALTIAIASLGTLIWTTEGTISEARLAVGSVAPTPARLRSVESALRGRMLDDALVADARQLITSSISPISDVRASAEYRKNVIGDLLVRALEAL